MTGYVSAGVDITSDIEAFTEFLVNRRETYQNGWRQFWNFGGTSNSFNTFWATGFQGRNFLSPTGITNLSDNSQTVDYYRGVGGLKGDIGFLPGWRFDSYVQFSRSNGKYRSQQILQDVYDSGYFQTASCVGTVLPVSGKQCIDLPWADPFFLAGQLTPTQADFLTDWETGKTRYDQLNGEVSLSGNLFRLPYGDLGVAVGASARRDKIRDVPGEITRAGNAWGASTSGITAGESLTTEAFAEINVPVLRDLPFARDLTFNAAARVTNVTAERASDGAKDKDNNNWTYKLGGNYAPTNWLRFRGTYGTSYRAPALFEQFLANETSFTAVRNIDPCTNYTSAFALGQITQRIVDNCASQGIPGNFTGGSITATVRSQGGLGLLEAETSTAKTASIILTPRFSFLPDTRFDFAVDWFDIKVKGQISQLGAGNIVFGCYNSDSFPTDPLCNLFTRAAAGTTQEFIIQTVDNKYINIASQRTAGFDFTTSVRHNAGGLGQFAFLGNATYTRKQEFALFVDTNENNAGEVGAPKFVGDLNFTWTSPGRTWSAFYGIDVIGKSSSRNELLEVDSDSQPGCFVPAADQPVIRGTYCPVVSTPTVLYHAASVTKEISGFDFTLGVSNLFDKRPPRVSVLNGGTISTLGQAAAVSQYDWLGRRFFVNVSARLGRGKR
jgi:iron complex outermembrane receptor protein